RLSFFFHSPAPHRDLHSFPTRRSSDLSETDIAGVMSLASSGYQSGLLHADGAKEDVPLTLRLDRGNRSSLSQLQTLKVAGAGGGDRKSTRLNSSHRTISYAVFCLKKKT